MTAADCCVLNGGAGEWAFAVHAARLGRVLGVDVAETPRRFNYLLHSDDPDPAAGGYLFIPLSGIRLAADKRELAAVFAAARVPTPETLLVDTPDDALRLLRDRPGREWCVKFPTGCGAAGHRELTPDLALPRSWPRPLLVQEFVRLARPEVYRTYAAGGEPFGWVVRRFPDGARPSPWVAHARGARYADAGEAPPDAAAAARAALAATGLLDSFGCADLLRKPSGEWVVLEVGTDGLVNHVDRDLGLPAVERELDRRVAVAFRAWAGATRSSTA